MTFIRNILPQFQSIGLAELNKADLMERTETKFWFGEEMLFEVLEAIQSQYNVLEISEKRIQHYQSEYYDTPEKKLYLAHHNGRLNRYKIRTRYYSDSGLGFFEVKLKNNKSRTVKKRINYPYAYGPLTDQAIDFLQNIYPGVTGYLSPVIKVEYNRLTLVRKDSVSGVGSERVTIDSGLTYIGNETINLNGLIIVEIKQDIKSKSPLMAEMKFRHIRPESLSKYCLGMALLNPNLKRNNFLYRINKLEKYVATIRNTFKQF